MRPYTGDRASLMAVAFTTTLALIVGYDLWFGSRTTLPEMRHVLPNSRAYLVTGPLREIWKNGANHITKLFSDAASADGQALVAIVNQVFHERCQSIDSLKDLSAVGIDTSRGITVTIANIADGVVAALPIANRAAFEAYARKLGVVPLMLSVPDRESGKKKPHSINVRVSQAEGVSGCFVSSGRIVDVEPGSTISATLDVDHDKSELTLAFVQKSSEPAQLAFGCSIEYENGEPADCKCTLNGTPCSEKIEFPQSFAETAEIGGMPTEGIRLANGHFLFFVNEGRTALLSSTVTLAAAASQERENIEFFRKDDTFALSSARLADIGREADGMLFGAFNMAFDPIAGNAHFAVAVGPQRLSVRALIPWQTLGTTLLESLAKPATRSEHQELPLSRSAELRVNDESLGYYLRFSRWPDPNALARFGGFQGFFEEIAKLAHTGTLRVGLLGIRDGIPDVVMSLGVSRDVAEEILLSQRRRARELRDKQILARAATKYRTDNQGTIPTEVTSVVREHIKPEAHAVWDNYSLEIASQKFLDGAEPAAQHDSDKYPGHQGMPKYDVALHSIKLRRLLPAEYFSEAGYDISWNGKLLRYISPSVTDNDIEYRLKPTENETIDVDALRAGRFRLIAYIDEPSNRILIGSHLDALTQALAAQPGSQPDVVDSESKLTLVGDPRFLVNQGELHSNTEVNEFVQNHLADFVQYSWLRATISPSPREHSIMATVVLSREYE